MKKLVYLVFILLSGSLVLRAQNWDSLQVDQKKREIKERQFLKSNNPVDANQNNKVEQAPENLRHNPFKRVNDDPEKERQLEKLTWTSWLMSSLHVQLLPIFVRGSELTYELRTRNMTSVALTGGYYINGTSNFISDNDYWEGYRFEGSLKKFNKQVFNSGYRYITFGAGYKSMRIVRFDYWSNQPGVVRNDEFASAGYLHGGTGTRQYLRKNVFIDCSISLLFVNSIDGKEAKLVETPVVNRYTTGFAFRMLVSLGVDF